MAKFIDSTGAEWSLRLTAGSLRRLREEAGFDLRANDAGQQIADLDPYGEQFGNIIWLLIEQQAAARGLTPGNFPDILDGETVERVMEAFVQAIIELFPNARLRKAAAEKIPGIQANEEAKMLAALERELSKLCAGNSPASSASTPTP